MCSDVTAVILITIIIIICLLLCCHVHLYVELAAHRRLARYGGLSCWAWQLSLLFLPWALTFPHFRPTDRTLLAISHRERRQYAPALHGQGWHSYRESERLTERERWWWCDITALLLTDFRSFTLLLLQKTAREIQQTGGFSNSWQLNWRAGAQIRGYESSEINNNTEATVAPLELFDAEEKNCQRRWNRQSRHNNTLIKMH